MLTFDERQVLLSHARLAIRTRLEGDGAPVALSAAGGLGVPGAAFVTIRHENQLRGCVGVLKRHDPFNEVVWCCAGDAATRDPRFPALSVHDLSEVTLEISVLGCFEPVFDPEEIEMGRHGVLVERGRRRGLLLPQVPVEFGWNRETFLTQTCIKGGLAPDDWQRCASLSRFETECFCE